MSQKLIFSLFIAIFAIFITMNFISTEKFDEYVMKRCNTSLPKDKADLCAKCEAEIPKLMKDPITTCAKEVCNSAGNYTKADICCFETKPYLMENCYHNKTELAAKAEGLKEEEANNRTESYIDKYEACLSKIFV